MMQQRFSSVTFWPMAFINFFILHHLSIACLFIQAVTFLRIFSIQLSIIQTLRKEKPSCILWDLSHIERITVEAKMWVLLKYCSATAAEHLADEGRWRRIFLLSGPLWVRLSDSETAARTSRRPLFVPNHAGGPPRLLQVPKLPISFELEELFCHFKSSFIH